MSVQFLIPPLFRESNLRIRGLWGPTPAVSFLCLWIVRYNVGVSPITLRSDEQVSRSVVTVVRPSDDRENIGEKALTYTLSRRLRVTELLLWQMNQIGPTSSPCHTTIWPTSVCGQPSDVSQTRTLSFGTSGLRVTPPSRRVRTETSYLDPRTQTWLLPLQL